MLSRILNRLAVAVLALIAALVLIIYAVGRFDPDLHGLIGWLIILGLPASLLALAWVFAPRRRS
jgi:hypothetical protein